MSAPQGESEVTAQVLEPPRRSRWRRFSPSMGWRAFWSEIVIVVLGVVIALAANEAVQDSSWRNKVEDAEARLQGDIAWTFLWDAERYATHPCVDAQLAALGRKVLESGQTLDRAPVLFANEVNYVVRIPNRPYRFPAWDSLVADGTATHFSLKRQAFLGRINDAMAGARESQAETRRLMGRLLVMRDPIALDPVVRADLLTAVNDLRSTSDFEALNALQRMRAIADAGSAPRADVVDAFLDGSDPTRAASESSGSMKFCKARGLPSAPWRDFERASVSTGFEPGARTAK